MARKRKIDFSNVQAYKRCEEGIHTAKLISLEDKATQNGDDMLAATFEVTKGNSEGARVFDNFVLTDKALWKLKSALVAMGVKAEGKVNLDLDSLIGKTCDIEVAHEEYNGQVRARILGYSKASTTALLDDDEDIDDDIDEDEEEEVEEKPAPKKKAKDKPAPKKKEEPKKELNEDEDDDWEDDEDWEED